MAEPTAISDPPLRFERFELLPAERVLRVDGQPVALGSRAFDVLLALAQRHDRLVGKQELLDLVWPGLVVEEHNIATQIGTLRKLLGAEAIATVAGRGYRLAAARATTPVQAPARDEAPSPPHNLPQPRTRFIGREAALADLARLLPQSRLLTLIGIGGCGKTRLALQFAQAQRAAFPDGAWFVDLAPVSQASRVAAACAAVVGVREEGDEPLVERLLAHLAARRCLLLLDNCEHVLDGVAALVDALLPVAGGAAVLATSREALGVAGEQIYPVPSLSLPGSDAPAAVREAEAVRVFVDRARLALPDFEVDDANARPVAEICRRLDGIALAIELAAARVPMLPPAEIEARLNDRFRLLTGGSRALPRHQTLAAAMQWSYEQLTAEEQRLLRLVSVFSGGWTLAAAADVASTADEYEALALLTALHDKSLLIVDRHEAAAAPRYRMLETVRQYALDRLHERGELQAARDRHLAHFVGVAEAAEPHLRGPDQDAWIRRIRAEHDNLIAALAWCCEGAGDTQLGLRLAAATSFYWLWNGVELGDRLARAVLERDLEAHDTLARAGTLSAIARLSLFRGRYAAALDHAQQALQVARRLGAMRPLVMALGDVGSALDAAGRTDEALRHHEEALSLARKLGDARLVAGLLNDMAEARRSAGQLEEAERLYREALEFARANGARLSIVTILNNHIRILVARGRPEEARRCAIECVPLVRGEKISVDLLEACVGLASCLGEHEMAARLWGTADQRLQEWGYRHQPVDIEHRTPLLARSRAALGDAAFDAAEAAGRSQDDATALLELQRWLERVGAG